MAKTIKELKAAETEVAYKVTELPSQEDPRITVQCKFKNLFFKALPEQIMLGEELLYFSKSDVAIITHLATKRTADKDKKILESKQRYCFISSQHVIDIFHEEGLKTISCRELVNGHPLTKHLKDSDKIAAGYVIGFEDCQEKRSKV